MANKVTLNHREIARFLKGAEVQAMLAAQAKRLQAGTGSPNFGSDVKVGRDRARGYVFPTNNAGRREQAANHLLERAVGGVG